MTPSIHLQLNTQRWLRDSPLTPYAIGYYDYLVLRRYSVETIEKHLASIAHLGRWMGQCHLPIGQLDEGAVTRFLDEHLPFCDCPRPAFGSRPDLRAACHHLLRVLRDLGVIPAPVVPASPIDREVARFDEYLCNVKGLGTETRRNYRRVVRQLLEHRFGGEEIAFQALQPSDVRRFIANQPERRTTSASASATAVALRAYLRFRALCGDDVHALQGAISTPAHWSLASLPKSLSDEEVGRLLEAFPPGLPSRRRAYAMVRCALDMGLRAGEIAHLALADID